MRNGTGKTLNLTNTPEEDEFAPSWAPKGKQIAFHTDSFGGDGFVLDLERGQSQNLTNDGTAHGDSNPNWSPDGTGIVFEGSGYKDRPGYDDYFDRIYTMKASDGSDRQLLTQAWSDDLGDGEYLKGPAYSPDGKQIGYVKTATDYVYSRPKLFKMNASTGANKQLVYNAYNPGPGHYPYGEGVSLSVPDGGARSSARANLHRGAGVKRSPTCWKPAFSERGATLTGRVSDRV